jgi:hypothetical protein
VFEALCVAARFSLLANVVDQFWLWFFDGFDYSWRGCLSVGVCFGVLGKYSGDLLC